MARRTGVEGDYVSGVGFPVTEAGQHAMRLTLRTEAKSHGHAVFNFHCDFSGGLLPCDFRLGEQQPADGVQRVSGSWLEAGRQGSRVAGMRHVPRCRGEFAGRRAIRVHELQGEVDSFKYATERYVKCLRSLEQQSENDAIKA